MAVTPTFRQTSDLTLLSDLLADAMTGTPEVRRSRIRSSLETGQAVVAEIDGTPVAAAIGHREGDYWIIDAIATHPTHRRSAVGRRLIEQLAAHQAALTLAEKIRVSDGAHWSDL